MTIARVTQSFTRPSDTTAYADGDLVANSTTAGSVTPLAFAIPRVGGGARVVQASLTKTDASDVANATFRLHFYSDSPTPANGDNGAWSTDIAGYLGTFALPIMTAFTDDAYTIDTLVVGSDIVVDVALNPVIYVLIEADAAYGPASAEVFTLTLFFEITA